jgi:hypothetical protein
MISTRTQGWLWFAVVLLAVGLAGCAHQPSPIPFGDRPGFFYGFFHGITIPFAFVASLFTDVTIYAWPNSGGWYNLGFVLGASALGSVGR